MFPFSGLILRQIELPAFQKFTYIMGYSRKSPNNEVIEFPGILQSIQKFQGLSKKEGNFHLIKNKSYEI